MYKVLVKIQDFQMQDALNHLLEKGYEVKHIFQDSRTGVFTIIAVESGQKY